MIPEAFKTRQEWLDARSRSIGSSDAPCLWNCSYSTQSYYALWAEKVHGVRHEFSKADLRRMELGKAAEPKIREWFAEETGFTVHTDGDTAIRRHLTIPFLTASLDSFVMHDEYGLCPVELKKVGPHNKAKWWDECGNLATPLGYVVQVGHQMLVTGSKMAYVVGLLDDSELLIREVYMDDEWRSAHLERCGTFWNYVESKTQPPIDASPATTDALKRLFPKSDPSQVVDLPAEADEWTLQIGLLEAEAKSVGERIDECKNRIRGALGDAEQGITPGGTRWTWKTQHKKAYTVKESSSRVLRKAT